ncbi:MAG: translation initiation factor IF-5A [Halobacteriota archaeon]|nr:translation initiation factor IF-5A [Halobacteriota archaeon]
MKEQTEVRTLKKGRYVMIDGEPCTIVNLSTSKPGKHGSSKARIDAMGIFDGQKRSIVQPVNAKIDVPIVERKLGQVLSIANDTVQIMNMDDYSTMELKIPDDIKEKVKVGEDLSYLTSMGKFKIDMR